MPFRVRLRAVRAARRARVSFVCHVWRRPCGVCGRRSCGARTWFERSRFLGVSRQRGRSRPGENRKCAEPAILGDPRYPEAISEIPRHRLIRCDPTRPAHMTVNIEHTDTRRDALRICHRRAAAQRSNSARSPPPTTAHRPPLPQLRPSDHTHVTLPSTSPLGDNKRVLQNATSPKGRASRCSSSRTLLHTLTARARMPSQAQHTIRCVLYR